MGPRKGAHCLASLLHSCFEQLERRACAVLAQTGAVYAQRRQGARGARTPRERALSLKPSQFLRVFKVQKVFLLNRVRCL